MQEVDLERLKTSNLDRLEMLAAQGINLSVGDLAFIKMEALISLLVTSEEELKQLELIVENKKKEIIDQVMAEIRKAQIVDGVKSHKLGNIRR